MAKANSTLPRGFKAEAERMSEFYRSELGISKFDALDAFTLAEYLDIPICPLNQILCEADTKKLTHPTDGRKDFSALWMPNCDGDPVIIHNPFHSEYRQQSNLMHEIAHIVRGHQTTDEIRKLCLLLNLRSYNKLQEEEAKYLGGCLQITRAGLLWAIKRFNEDQISKYFTASIDMVRYRLRITGVAKQKGYYNS